jgi:hypothetical protein
MVRAKSPLPHRQEGHTRELDRGGVATARRPVLRLYLLGLQHQLSRQFQKLCCHRKLALGRKATELFGPLQEMIDIGARGHRPA